MRNSPSGSWAVSRSNVCFCFSPWTESISIHELAPENRNVTENLILSTGCEIIIGIVFVWISLVSMFRLLPCHRMSVWNVRVSVWRRSAAPLAAAESLSVSCVFAAKPISLVERCWCRSTVNTVPQRSVKELKFLHTPNCPFQVMWVNKPQRNLTSHFLTGEKKEKPTSCAFAPPSNINLY